MTGWVECCDEISVVVGERKPECRDWLWTLEKYRDVADGMLRETRGL